MALNGRTICVNKIEGNTVMSIPFVEDNTDYQEYLKWIEAGNVPEPAEGAE